MTYEIISKDFYPISGANGVVQGKTVEMVMGSYKKRAAAERCFQRCLANRTNKHTTYTIRVKAA